jgi:hypothetical protein
MKRSEWQVTIGTARCGGVDTGSAGLCFDRWSGQERSYTAQESKTPSWSHKGKQSRSTSSARTLAQTNQPVLPRSAYRDAQRPQTQPCPRSLARTPALFKISNHIHEHVNSNRRVNEGERSTETLTDGAVAAMASNPAPVPKPSSSTVSLG